MRGNAAQVTLVSRRALRKREAEVGPEWAGSKALREYRACSEALERLGAARDARGGATLNTLSWNALRAALRSGAPLAIEERADVAEATWDGAQWELRLAPAGTAAAAAETQPPTPPSASPADADADDAEPLAPEGARAAAHGDGPPAVLIADVVWVACGSAPDAGRDPVLSALRARDAPARILGGLPVLEAGLRWPGAPLFCLGAWLAKRHSSGADAHRERVVARTVTRTDAALTRRVRAPRAGAYATLSLGPAACLPSGQRAGGEAAVAAVAACRAAVAAGERPYDAAAGALPLDMLYDDDDVADPHCALPPSAAAAAAAAAAAKRPLAGGALIDVSDLQASLPRHELTAYAWHDSAADNGGDVTPDEAFTIEVSVQIPEAVARSGVRVAFTETGAELWAVCAGGAYRLHLPRLYRRIIPQRCTVAVAPRSRRLTLRMHKLDSQEWRFLKGI